LLIFHTEEVLIWKVKNQRFWKVKTSVDSGPVPKAGLTVVTRCSSWLHFTPLSGDQSIAGIKLDDIEAEPEN